MIHQPSFFIQIIHGFRRQMDMVSKTATCSFMTDTEASQVTLSQFSQVSSTIIHHVIQALSTKSFPLNLDPIPIQLLKDHLDLIGPVVTVIVNELLSTGVFQLVSNIPLYDHFWKKKYLDWQNLKNYRPVANIPFLSKVVKKAVVLQMNIFWLPSTR